jgi:hypothetical protein
MVLKRELLFRSNLFCCICFPGLLLKYTTKLDSSKEQKCIISLYFKVRSSKSKCKRTILLIKPVGKKNLSFPLPFLLPAFPSLLSISGCQSLSLSFPGLLLQYSSLWFSSHSIIPMSITCCDIIPLLKTLCTLY